MQNNLAFYKLDLKICEQNSENISPLLIIQHLKLNSIHAVLTHNQKQTLCQWCRVHFNQLIILGWIWLIASENRPYFNVIGVKYIKYAQRETKISRNRYNIANSPRAHNNTRITSHRKGTGGPRILITTCIIIITSGQRPFR